MPNNKKPVLCILGPTASGKTGLALALAEHYPLHLISLDSTLIYKGMDIGSAKPDKTILTHFPHALVDIKTPCESYSVAEFLEDAQAEITKAHQTEKMPTFVGGTMMYYQAMREGLSPLPPADLKLRQQIAQRAKQFGWAALHQQLIQLDPYAASKISSQDGQRIQRALEVHYITGRPISTFWQQTTPSLFEHYHFASLGLMTKERSQLHHRIALRSKEMLAAGLVEEVKQLLRLYPQAVDSPAFRSVGYRQVIEMLNGHFSKSMLLDKIIVATRQLAKRQLTWLRRYPDIQWFDSESKQLCSDVIHWLSLQKLLD